MSKTQLLVMLAISALPVTPALAQQKTVNIGEVYVMVPKPGMAKQFEEGRKRHMAWHKKQNDAWSWNTWQVITGEATGAYLSTTFDHTWKDFDDWYAKFATADSADVDTNITPYLAATSGSVWQYMANVSRPPDSQAPPKMAEVLHFMVKPDAESDFNYALGKIDEAIKKTNWTAHYMTYSLANGGEGPHYVIVFPHDSWADMAEPEVSFDAMMEKAFGKHEGEAVSKEIDRTLKSEWSEMLVYRADLSYVPASK
jgi:hypothetical protein